LMGRYRTGVYFRGRGKSKIFYPSRHPIDKKPSFL
jgi:hypothetical protein